MTSRRAFLFGATAALAAPSIVRAESLMKLWVPKPKVLTAQTLLEAMERIHNQMRPVWVRMAFSAVDGSMGHVIDRPVWIQ